MALWASGGLAAVLGAGLLLAPPLGTDLSAQVARARFVREYGLIPVDMRWYGGTVQYGYSWTSAALMAVPGPIVAGVLAMIASTVALAVLLVRCRAPRPVAGSLLGAVVFAANLVSGRVTFALGVAIGMWALVALAPPGRHPERVGTDRGKDSGTDAVRSRVRPRIRLGLAAAGALLAGATSPVAGLFAGLAGVAVALAASLPEGRAGDRPASRRAGDWSGSRRAGDWPGSGRVVADRARAGRESAARRRDGLVFALAAGLPLAVTAVLVRDGGTMNIYPAEAFRAVLTSLAVAALVRVPAIRMGGLLSSAMVLGALLVSSPVGVNATRLATMFALPVVAAYGQLPAPLLRRIPALATRAQGWRWLALTLLALAVWQPPVVTRDLQDAGNPTASRSYFAPLLAELQRRQPVGRVEVPPTRDRWESVYVADTVQLARGWLTQVDERHNALFFDGSLDATNYRAWLHENGVSYVALPDAIPAWAARQEVALVRGGLPYLSEVWRSEHWVLYQTPGDSSIVEGGALVAATGSAVVFDAAAPGEILVRVNASSWLRVRGPAGAQARAEDRWTVVRVRAAGRYVLSS